MTAAPAVTRNEPSSTQPRDVWPQKKCGQPGIRSRSPAGDSNGRRSAGRPRGTALAWLQGDWHANPPAWPRAGSPGRPAIRTVPEAARRLGASSACRLDAAGASDRWSESSANIWESASHGSPPRLTSPLPWTVQALAPESCIPFLPLCRDDPPHDRRKWLRRSVHYARDGESPKRLDRSSAAH